MTNHLDSQEFEQLCDRVLDGQASASEIAQLESLVLSSLDYRKKYAEMAEIHGSLSVLGAESFDRVPPTQAVSRRVDGKPNSSSRLLSLAAFVTVMVFLISIGLSGWLSSGNDRTFAEIQSVSSCLWEESTEPARKGQRLGASRFRLAQGIATIHFDNGAKVDFEGPVEFELVDSDLCELHSGKLVATVDNGVKRFTVKTPNGDLIERGTSFGVSVASNGDSQVQVFDGRVDVEHRVSGEKRILEGNTTAVLLAKSIASPKKSRGPSIPQQSVTVRQVTTAMGAGMDHWIQRDPSIRDGSDELLLCKSAKPPLNQWDRRSYLKFDLSNIPIEEFDQASLQLTSASSGMGYASRVTDSTFAVYGVVDSSLDEWSPATLTWKNSPGYKNGEMLADVVRLLGRFTVPKGIYNGSYDIETEELLLFLKENKNNLATVFIVNETVENHWGGLVLGFASSRHPTLPPPTLRLWNGP